MLLVFISHGNLLRLPFLMVPFEPRSSAANLASLSSWASTANGRFSAGVIACHFSAMIFESSLCDFVAFLNSPSFKAQER